MRSDVPCGAPSESGPRGLAWTLAITAVVASAFWVVGLWATGSCAFGDSLRYAANAKSLLDARRPFPAAIPWSDFATGNRSFGSNRGYPGMLYSAMLAGVYSLVGKAAVWWGVIPSYAFFVLGSCATAMLYRRFLAGWEFWFILLIALASPVVLDAGVRPGTDVVAWGLLMSALALAMGPRARPFAIGILVGVATQIRSPALLFSLPLPILMGRALTRKELVRLVIRMLTGFALATCVVQAGLWLWLDKTSSGSNLVASAASGSWRPTTVSRGDHAASHRIDPPHRVPAAPSSSAVIRQSAQEGDTQAQTLRPSSAGESALRVTPTTQPRPGRGGVGWYLQEITQGKSNLSASWYLTWLAKQVWNTFGPKSHIFGVSLFLVACSLFCRSEHPQISRLNWFLVLSLMVMYIPAGVLFNASYFEKSPSEVMLPGRYFMEHAPLLVLVTWKIAREKLFRRFQLAPFASKLLSGPGGSRRPDASLLLSALLVAATFLTTMGNGLPQSLAVSCLGHRYPMTLPAIEDLERVLADLPRGAVIASNSPEFVNLVHPTRNLVALPKVLRDFQQAPFNAELDAIVIFFADPWEQNDSAWTQWVIESTLSDNVGTRFERAIATRTELIGFDAFLPTTTVRGTTEATSDTDPTTRRRVDLPAP